MRIKEFGENLVGISFGNGEVSFLTYRENINTKTIINHPNKAFLI